MSKSIKSVISDTVDMVVSPFAPQQNFDADYGLADYYNKLDTSAKDTAHNLMASAGVDLAQTLSNRPDYIYSVNGSDDAREQAQNATFQSYADRLIPQFQQQAADLQTQLANQGIGAGTAAYNSALESMYAAQNDAWNQAAYNSVTSGQDAYTQSLQNAINAATFSNSARMGAIDEINASLQNSLSQEEARTNAYNIEKGIETAKAKNWQDGFSNLMEVVQAIQKMKGKTNHAF